MVDRAKQILRKIIYLENETSFLDEIKATSLCFCWHSYEVGIIGGCKYGTQPIRASPCITFTLFTRLNCCCVNSGLSLVPGEVLVALKENKKYEPSFL